MATKRERVLDHLKQSSHSWVLVLTILAGFAYGARLYFHPQREAEFISNIVVCLFAAGTMASGLIAFVSMVCLKKDQFGELDSFKTYLIIGVILSVVVASVKLLGLFDLLPFVR